MNLHSAVDTVKASASFRVLTKLEIEKHSNIGLQHSCDKPMIGLCLDTETTGFTYGTDKIIELGMISYEFNPDTGGVIRILERYNGMEDPGYPLSQDVIKVTGIQDEMLQGKYLDDGRINTMLASADLICAHNAGFDRPFVEERFPITKEKAWACSMNQVDWSKEYITSRSLEYLLYKCGSWFIDAHRALNDAEGLLALLAEHLPDSGTSVNACLIAKAYSVDSRIYAVGAPYDTKDVLKSKGYRWSDGADGKPKAWWIDIPGDGQGELMWLAAHVYKPGAEKQIVVEHVDARCRFSKRVG